MLLIQIVSRLKGPFVQSVARKLLNYLQRQPFAGDNFYNEINKTPFSIGISPSYYINRQ